MKDTTLIVVLGMHRGGTSAMTRGLRAVGATFGENLLDPHEHNPKGFWEDKDILDLDMEMLQVIEQDWDHIAPLEASHVELLRRQGYFLRAVELLRTKTKNIPVFAFKDPRVAKLMPFWQEVFSHCQFNTRYLLAVRHPLSVVNSLVKRNNFRVERSYFLWLSQMLGALANTNGEKRILVDYDRLLLDPAKELTRIARSFALVVDQAELENFAANFLDQGLRHTCFALEDMELDTNCPRLVSDVYRQLLEVASDRLALDDPSFQERLNQWTKEWQEFSALMRLADSVCDDNDTANLRLYQSEHAVSQQEARISSLQASLTEHEQRIISLQANLADRDAQLSQSNQSIEVSASTIAKLNQAVSGLHGQIDSLNQAVSERDGQIAGLHQAVVDRDTQIANLHREVMDRDAFAASILSSTSWKLTSPCRTMGMRARILCKNLITAWHDKKRGVLVEGHPAEVNAPDFSLTPAPGDVAVEPCLPSPLKQDARELAKEPVQACAPLRVYSIKAAGSGRVNIITDSINSGFLYGGVGTAMILAALLAEARNSQLRIITRVEQAVAGNFAHILETYGLRLPYEVEFVFAPFWDNSYEMDVGRDEYFITTSWWTTAATMKSIPHEAVIYLLQEDERMFYPYGEERFRCSQVLRSKDINFVLNTRLLHDHLIAEGLDNISERGIWFEPAFPRDVFYPRQRSVEGKKTFMFYARPHNLRNLFYFGIELIDEAIKRGILDPGQWDVRLVGKDIPDLVFSGGCVPNCSENLQWAEYAELVGTVDLGLCLMYTPHPSYPPLDLAASGAVVVTNRFGRKQDLSCYSQNIICGDLDLEAMLTALAEGIRLAENREERQRNLSASGLGSDWRAAFAGVIKHFSRAL